MYQSAKEKAFKYGAAASAATLAMVQQAHAALPAEASTALTTLSTNVTDVLGGVWPIVALSVGGFTLIRLFKKGARSAV